MAFSLSHIWEASSHSITKSMELHTTIKGHHRFISKGKAIYDNSSIIIISILHNMHGIERNLDLQIIWRSLQNWKYIEVKINYENKYLLLLSSLPLFFQHLKDAAILFQHLKDAILYGKEVLSPWMKLRQLYGLRSHQIWDF